MTIVYGDKYKDIIVSGNKCFLFSGLFKHKEISKHIKKVFIGNTKEDIKVSSVAVRATLGMALFGPVGTILGALTAKTKTSTAYVITLDDDEQVVVGTDDKGIIYFMSKYLGRC